MNLLAELKEHIEYYRKRINTPLKKLVEVDAFPKVTPVGNTLGFTTPSGSGMATHPDGNMQIGSETARISLVPQAAAIALNGETQHEGMVKILPTGQHKVLEVNMGTMNGQLIPPKDPVRSARATAPLAVVAVRDLNRLPVDRPIVDLTKDVPLGMPGPEGVVTNAIYVIIPDHTHGTAVGPTTGVIAWAGPNQCPVKVHGVEYEYLFGHNRLSELPVRNMNSLYSSLLKEVG